jgi:uncharacterized protein YoxC
MQPYARSWLAAFCIVLLLGSSVSLAQSESAKPLVGSAESQDLERLADQVQQFILRWFPLIFIAGSVAIIILLWWIICVLEQIDGSLRKLRDCVGELRDCFDEVNQHLKGMELNEHLNGIKTQLERLAEEDYEYTSAMLQLEQALRQTSSRLAELTRAISDHDKPAE